MSKTNIAKRVKGLEAGATPSPRHRKPGYEDAMGEWFEAKMGKKVFGNLGLEEPENFDLQARSAELKAAIYAKREGVTEDQIRSKRAYLEECVDDYCDVFGDKLLEIMEDERRRLEGGADE